MAKEKNKELRKCNDCMEKISLENIEFCRLRGEKPTEYSVQPIGKEHECSWYKKK